MAEPFLGEIRIASFGFAPKGWALCKGQTLPINQNMALFSLLGTTYGGNGRDNFALPNLCGRMPIHFCNDFTQGELWGSQTVTLAANQIGHDHDATFTINVASGPGDSSSPAGKVWAAGQEERAYSSRPPDVDMAGDLVQVMLGSAGTAPPQPHDNMPPYIVINYIIALQGIFPSQT